VITRRHPTPADAILIAALPVWPCYRTIARLFEWLTPISPDLFFWQGAQEVDGQRDTAPATLNRSAREALWDRHSARSEGKSASRRTAASCLLSWSHTVPHRSQRQ
jgi:hypothetical protein